MLLTARILHHLSGVNDYEIGEGFVQFTEGDPATVYLQLVDATKDKGLNPPGRRYIPPATTTVTAVIKHNDDAKTLTRVLTQAFPTEDASIWALTILSTDELVGVRDLQLTMVEPSKTVRGVVKGALRIEPQTRAF